MNKFHVCVAVFCLALTFILGSVLSPQNSNFSKIAETNR
jgi:hypothetical protein